jgi:hypothetical protein
MPFGLLRCPDCHTLGRSRGGRRFRPPDRSTFDGRPAPVLAQERVCSECGAWLWVHAFGPLRRIEVSPAAPRLYALGETAGGRIDDVLAGIAATDAFKREYAAQRRSSAAWPSATVKRFS